ncbi:hypothetical protein ACFVW8_37715 [Streptomyces sp. NPDC058221]|uniref:hypothetical protein n=1 Tax=Streptomyces sp. NPDC058221 TaxID=3346388 RepID=UPI0036ED7ACA
MADIDWDNSRTPAAEAALAELGQHIGFTVQQPERDYGIGPDVLWALGQHTYAVIEAKTGAQAPRIWKKDINQLAGSVHWCHREYGSDATVTPVVVHPSHIVDKTGTPPIGTRVITASKLSALKQAVRQFARAVSQDGKYNKAAEIEHQLAALSLNVGVLVSNFTQAAYREAK